MEKKKSEKKVYSVSLDKDVVDEARIIIGNSGRKLSPVINNLLIKWIEENQES